MSYFLRNAEVYLLVFCLLVPNLFVCQGTTTLRKSTWEASTPHSVNSLLPQNSHDKIALQNLETDLERMVPQSVKTKLPSYQHKPSQLNADSMHTHNLRNILMSHYLLAKLPPQYRVATKVGKVHENQPSGGNTDSTLQNENNDVWATVGAERNPEKFSNPGASNYNPYVGRQAFTSIQKFFQQVHENLKVVLSEEQIRCGPKSTPHLLVGVNRNI